MSNPKSVAQLSATEKKALILEALAKEGYSPYQAAQILGVSKQLTYRIDKQMRMGLLTPLILKARKSIGLLVEGKLVGEMTEVKGSDVLTATKMVVDRYEPVVQKIQQSSVKMSVNLTDEERSRYNKLLGLDKPIDAKFETVPQIEKETK